MIILVCILLAVCAALTVYVYRIRKQLSEWLAYLKAVSDNPGRKSFVTGSGLLADINFEINAVLEENRKQLLRLTRAEEADKQILTNLSHDIRTPLASLSGYLEALDNGTVKEGDQNEYIHTAYRKALQLSEFVDILFEWFKLNSREEQYEIDKYDINELTRELIIGYLPAIERQHITLETDISDEEYFIWIDKIAYARIINNLISNAVRHGRCSKITIKIQKGDSAVRLEIGNNGELIPREQLPHIFDRLYKCDTSRSRNGSGLGLAIVNELAAAMRGSISAESSAEKGTVFCLVFPAAAP